MRPVIGITSGDPAGIGLEIIIKALPPLLGSGQWVLFTDRQIFERNIRLFPPSFDFRWIHGLAEVRDEPVLFLVDLGASPGGIAWGQSSPAAGARALAYLKEAADAATRGDIQAIVTAPVSKFAIGPGFHGQTDYLAERSGVSQFAMAFFAPTFKVILATIHMSLREALDRITTDHYIQLIRFAHRELRRFGFFQPRIAVAAINPHAGEQGMFGQEDDLVLRPAVQRCASEGIGVTGPHSADSLYYWAHTGGCDVVIAPYHDQGLIPIKLIAHGAATNVTLGLPYIRTSPDHGTAFAIAGKGMADPSGMESALKCALDLVAGSQRQSEQTP